MNIEIESGIYTARPSGHNGYYAGDFSRTPFKWAPLYVRDARPALVERSAMRTSR